jgi:hypothetical protein
VEKHLVDLVRSTRRPYAWLVLPKLPRTTQDAANSLGLTLDATRETKREDLLLLRETNDSAIQE